MSEPEYERTGMLVRLTSLSSIHFIHSVADLLNYLFQLLHGAQDVG